MTVEAAREDGQEKLHELPISPTKHLTQRTTTTLVPLKGAHDSSPAPAKRSRGRPGKSLNSPVKRTGTPKPRKTGRRKTQGGFTNEHSEGDVPVGATPPKRGRGRPRKSVDSEVEDLWRPSGSTFDQDQMPATSCIDESMTREEPTRRQSRGRRKAMTHAKPRMARESDSQTEGAIESDHSGGVDPNMSNVALDKRGTQQHRHSNSSLAAPPLDHHMTSVLAGPEPAIGDISHGQDANTRVQAPDEDPTYAEADHNSKVQPDPTDEHEEFDSILESEGFSMVSISSVPSARQHISSPAEAEHAAQLQASGLHSDEIQAKPSSQNQTLRAKTPSAGQRSKSFMRQSTGPGQSSILSYVPSSPPILIAPSQPQPLLERQTPSLIPSSPSFPPARQSVPPPQSPRSLNKPTVGTPKLTRVVRAGIALQGVLSPPKPSRNSEGSPDQHRSSSSASLRSPKERSDDLFTGFSAGTRRELRAGLRLGEELAKSQAAQHMHPSQKPAGMAGSAEIRAMDMDMFLDDAALAYPRLPTPDEKEEYALNLPNSQQQVEYPAISNVQLPSPQRSEAGDLDERMSWKADTPLKPVLSPRKQTGDNVSPEMSRIFRDDTMLLNWKAEWQRERETVSKQIQSASESQVIVIYSDDSDTVADVDQKEATDGEEDVDEDDIWQAEANSSDHVRDTTPEVSKVSFQEEAVRPRRSKLPSPWRRNSQVVYSDQMLQNESDLFWQPSQRQKSTRTRQRQEPSSISVLSEYVSPDRNDRLTHSNVTSSPVPLSQRDTPPCAAEEKILVEEVREEVTVLEAIRIPDEVSDTSELEDGVEENTTPDSFTQAASPPTSTSTPPPAPPSKSWFSRLTSIAPTSLTSLTSLASTYLLPSSTSQQPQYAIPPDLPTLKKPLSPYHPFTTAHYRALNPLYKDSKIHPEHYPYRPDGVAAWLLGQEVHSRGWEREIEEIWCGVVEVFMEAYLQDSEVGAEKGKKRGFICEREVMKRVFSLWVQDVQRGLVEWDGPRGD